MFNTNMFGTIDRYGYYIGLDGRPISRTPYEYPYNYDEYVLFKSTEFSENDSWVYSDRMMQWNFDKFTNCVKEIWHDRSQYFNTRTPASIQAFLSMYFDKEVELTAVLQGCNASDGYPYWVFAYRELKPMRLTFRDFMKRYLNRNGVRSDLANDMQDDVEFPVNIGTDLKADKKKIRHYLESKRCCEGCIDAFIVSWKSYTQYLKHHPEV